MGIPKITWMFNGKENGYRVLLGKEHVYFTLDPRDRDMFIAELKGRLAMAAKQMEKRG